MATAMQNGCRLNTTEYMGTSFNSASPIWRGSAMRLLPMVHDPMIHTPKHSSNSFIPNTQCALLSATRSQHAYAGGPSRWHRLGSAPVVSCYWFVAANGGVRSSQIFDPSFDRPGTEAEGEATAREA